MRLLRNRTLVAVSVAVGAAYTGFGLVGPVHILYAQSPGAVYGDCVLAGGLVIRSAGAPACRTAVSQLYQGSR